jgi:hypothetical protein
MPLTLLLAPLLVSKSYLHLCITTVSSKLLFSLGTFDSFLDGLDRNQVHGAYFSSKMVYKPVKTCKQT